MQYTIPWVLSSISLYQTVGDCSVLQPYLVSECLVCIPYNTGHLKAQLHCPMFPSHPGTLAETNCNLHVETFSHQPESSVLYSITTIEYNFIKLANILI